MTEDIKKLHDEGCGEHDCHDPHCHGEHEHEDVLNIQDLLPDEAEMDEYTIVMADEETGEEYTFFMADDFEMDGTVYMVLLSVEDDPEAIFAKVVELEDGSEGFETLDDDEFERVADYYEELCAEGELGDFGDEDDEDEDDEEVEE